MFYLFLYNLGVKLFTLLVRIVSIFNPKARLWINGRRELFQKLRVAFTNNTSSVIWFHAASLGEFEQGRPLIEMFKSRHPDIKILLTFYSPSGYEVRKNYASADFVFYLPEDSASNARDFIEIVDPVAVFFIKYEFWYHYIHTLFEKGIPVYSVSAIFRPGQIFFKAYGRVMRDLLAQLSRIYVQNESSKLLLSSIGISSIVSGDTRFDRVKYLNQQKKSYPEIEKFCGSASILIIGSSWPEDLAIILPYLKQYLIAHPDFKLILAPHEIDKQALLDLKSEFLSNNCISLFYSELIDYQTGSSPQVLIIDNIGMLSSLYQYGHVAYVGGGFGKGIHNILEAATFGLPVIFAPNYQRFKEAVDLIELHGAFSIGSTSSFTKIFEKLIQNPKILKEAGIICQSYVESNAGATELIYKHVIGEILTKIEGK